MPSDFVPMPSWRLSVAEKSMREEQSVSDSASQRWSPLAVKVHATQLYDLEMVDLLNILDTYQSSQRVKVNASLRLVRPLNTDYLLEPRSQCNLCPRLCLLRLL